mmetsp:Transcript_31066/g.27475  ORF Transcript_31066/g.27475 Transcript_31066/m.27475 type:complete len:127 (+) Transcript_31066:268-648(+)
MEILDEKEGLGGYYRHPVFEKWKSEERSNEIMEREKDKLKLGIQERIKKYSKEVKEKIVPKRMNENKILKQKLLIESIKPSKELNNSKNLDKILEKVRLKILVTNEILGIKTDKDNLKHHRRIQHS